MSDYWDDDKPGGLRYITTESTRSDEEDAPTELLNKDTPTTADEKNVSPSIKEMHPGVVALVQHRAADRLADALLGRRPALITIHPMARAYLWNAADWFTGSKSTMEPPLGARGCARSVPYTLKSGANKTPEEARTKVNNPERAMVVKTAKSKEPNDYKLPLAESWITAFSNIKLDLNGQFNPQSWIETFARLSLSTEDSKK